MSTVANTGREARRGRRAARWRWAGVAAVAVAAWFFWPRHATLREFAPEAIGRAEADLWRHYYRRDNVRLFTGLWSLARKQFGLSPCDSLRLAWSAARAAGRFRSSRGRAEAAAALPPLETYYGIIRDRCGESFDVHRAAQLELEWWQLRREQATPREYGLAIARSSAEVYGITNPLMVTAAVRRAGWMDFRDRRRAAGLTDAEWKQVTDGLVEAWTELREAIRRSANGDGAPEGAME